MREEYAHGAPPADATVRGFGHGAKIVTAAALIMLAVFGSFVLADVQVIKGKGFALCISVLLDAFVSRPHGAGAGRHGDLRRPGLVASALPPTAPCRGRLPGTVRWFARSGRQALKRYAPARAR